MITNDCIEWDMALDQGFYGIAWVPAERSNRRAHRVVWEEVHGPIPPGMCVCHRCDNPPCINVEHLFLGSNADNSADMVAKGRCVRGPASHLSKLTEAQVWAIRDRLTAGESQSSVGRSFGVTVQSVWAIKHGKTWAWLTERPNFLKIIGAGGN